jgi:hypothetical protein
MTHCRSRNRWSICPDCRYCNKYKWISQNLCTLFLTKPITVGPRSKARTAFPCSSAGIVGSNPTQGMDVCVCICSVFLCPTVCVRKITKLRKRPGPNKGDIEILMNEVMKWINLLLKRIINFFTGNMYFLNEFVYICKRNVSPALNFFFLIDFMPISLPRALHWLTFHFNYDLIRQWHGRIW